MNTKSLCGVRRPPRPHTENPALMMPGYPRVGEVPASAGKFLVRSGEMAAGRPWALSNFSVDFLADGRVIAAKAVIDDMYRRAAPLAGQQSN